MRIKKMLLLASMAVAAVAFAVPAMAQASELTESGTKLAIGAEVTATSTNLVTKSEVGTLECKLVTIHGAVAENGPTVRLTEKSTTVSECNHTITNPKSGPISLSGGTGSSTGSTFLAEGICDFEGNIPFSYVSGTSVLTVTGENQLSSACGKATMSGSFSIETSNGTAVKIS